MALITCPTNCESALPPVNFSACAPTILESEIVRVFIARPNAAAFTNWEQATEWTERISQTDVADQDAIRVLTVIGDKPAPTSTPRDISNGRTITPFKEHTVNVTIDDVTDENYEFMRQLECGGQVKAWYETAGGKLYGGNEGITKARLSLDDILPSGEEIETLQGTLTWRNKFHPERTDSPIFGTDYPTTVVPPVGG